MEMFMTPLEFNHADAEQLESYSLGRLPEPEVASLEEHLLVCEHCRDHLDETEVYLRAMRGAMHKLDSPRKTRNWLRVPAFRWTLAPIAALALIGVVGTQFKHRTGDSPARVQLYAMRGDAAPQSAVAYRPLDLSVDARGLPVGTPYRMQLVDLAGKILWEGTAAAEGANLRSVAQTRLPAGSYFVRVYGSGPESLREYGLSVR